MKIIVVGAIVAIFGVLMPWTVDIVSDQAQKDVSNSYSIYGYQTTQGLVIIVLILMLIALGFCEPRLRAFNYLTNISIVIVGFVIFMLSEYCLDTQQLHLYATDSFTAVTEQKMGLLVTILGSAILATGAATLLYEYKYPSSD